VLLLKGWRGTVLPPWLDQKSSAVYASLRERAGHALLCRFGLHPGLVKVRQTLVIPSHGGPPVSRKRAGAADGLGRRFAHGNVGAARPPFPPLWWQSASPSGSPGGPPERGAPARRRDAVHWPRRGPMSGDHTEQDPKVGRSLGTENACHFLGQFPLPARGNWPLRWRGPNSCHLGVGASSLFTQSPCKRPVQFSSTHSSRILRSGRLRHPCGAG
jgi:hypothetical protein